MDLAVFYAAVIAVENGIGEIEIIHQTDIDGIPTMTTVLIRREVRHIEGVIE